MGTCAADLAFRGLIHQASDDALLAKLDAGALTAYIGFDPTSDSLHVGSLLQLCNLKRLQLAGNAPITLAGGATGMIGDPGGKTEERQLLSREQIEANLEGIKPQLERFLDFSADAPAPARVVNNADWLLDYGLIDFLREVGKNFTVNQMITKESVRSRIERPEQGISFTEFSYMLLQATDYLHLFDAFGCRLQMGASDQWGNITMGIDLIRRERSETAYGLTSPLVLKPDGTKFGKTESGTLFLDAKKTSPYQLYQYFYRSEDAVVPTYLRYFTFLDHEQILELDDAVRDRPERREAQRMLAREVTSLVHGPEWTERVERAAEALYSEDVAALDEATLLMALADAPSTVLDPAALHGEGVDLVDALVLTGLVASKSAARTAISQGGAYVNNRRAPESARLTPSDLIAGRYVLLRRGRRELHLVSFGERA
jgi:tyrosyl-tRNA synthetase